MGSLCLESFVCFDLLLFTLCNVRKRSFEVEIS